MRFLMLIGVMFFSLCVSAQTTTDTLIQVDSVNFIIITTTIDTQEINSLELAQKYLDDAINAENSKKILEEKIIEMTKTFNATKQRYKNSPLNTSGETYLQALNEKLKSRWTNNDWKLVVGSDVYIVSRTAANDVILKDKSQNLRVKLSYTSIDTINLSQSSNKASFFLDTVELVESKDEQGNRKYVGKNASGERVVLKALNL